MTGAVEERRITATDFQRSAGEVLWAVAGGKALVITYHARAVAVLISVEEYERLKAIERAANAAGNGAVR